MSGVDIQDLTPVVIGSKAKRGSNTSKVPGETKASGVVGIGGKLESGTARKLDNNEAKAPEAVGKEVGRVGLETMIFRTSYL